MLDYETGQRLCPSTGWPRPGQRPSAVTLELSDDFGTGKFFALIASPQLALVVNGVIQPGAHQIAGTGTHQQESDSSCRRMNLLERGAMSRGCRIGGEPGR
jgi:hypothetical protein